MDRLEIEIKEDLTVLTIRPAFTAYIRHTTGLSVLGAECGQLPTEGAAEDRLVLSAAARGSRQPTLDKIYRVVSEEPVQADNFREAPVEGIFALDLHGTQDRVGTLFVDATPQAEGVQFFFYQAGRSRA